ncbi:MAG: helicase-exonuclease AddAB subunit AddA [Clostridia bacterium]|nr:helicase-exonuclease AddAB subunit AddA [Clostridia bacterium]
MERKWTPAQRAAIDARGQDILISAAAGSGKTAVLTRRIIERITDPTDPLSVDDLLVVTFSEAAAGELQVRIRRAILDQLAKDGGSRRMRRQLLLLERAEISTIHSFCLKQIRKNAALLELPVSMRVCDEGERGRLSGQIMERLLDDLYQSGDADFLELIAQFAVLSDDRIADQLLKLYAKTTSLPEGVSYFADSARRMTDAVGEGIMSGSYGGLLWGYLDAYLQHYAPKYRRAQEMLVQMMADTRIEASLADTKERKRLEKRLLKMEEIRAFYAAEGGALEALTASADDYGRLYDAVWRVVYEHKPTLTAAPELTAATAFRDDAKSAFEAMRKTFFPAARREAVQSDIAKTARLLQALARLMEEFDRRFTAEKKRLGLLDFSDLEHYTHRLLVRDGAPTELARAVSRSYREIYIDEYQDVNRIQDEIFAAISTQNRFMVGDIKQSIYGFRGAEPSIFADYRSRFDSGDGGKTIYLSHNFRCDQSVVDFVNLVCEDMFVEGGTVRYTEGDRLIRGKEDDKDKKVPVQVTLIEKGSTPAAEGEALTARAAEAEYIAAEVERLWKMEGIPLKKMAVLMRSLDGRIPHLEEAFHRHGIPCIHNRAMPFFEEPEILTLLSLLYTIENPTRDIYLAGALTGPVFGFTMEELIALRRPEGMPVVGDSLYEALSARRGDPKVDYFFGWLEDYRQASCTLSSDELIRKLYAETALPAIVGADPLRGKAAEQNLRSFYQLARGYEKSSFRGLHRFLRYVGDLAERGQGVDRKAELGDDDALQIMTIHHSKGLEFEVCFVADTGSTFNLQDSSAAFLFDRERGMTLTLRDSETLGKYQTLPRQILSKRIAQQSLEEEMRNLYVALTRAVNRLYVTSWLTHPKSVMTRAADLAEQFDYYNVMDCTSYIQWIMGALTAHPEKRDACCRVTRLVSTPEGFALHPDTPADEGTAEAMPSLSEAAPTEPDTIEPLPADSVREPRSDTETAEETAERIGKRFDFIYPHDVGGDLPAKLTVSRLSPDILDADEETSAELHTGISLKRTPAFMQSSPNALSGAERGTATHLFMQFCDFESLEKNGVEAELLRLSSKQFISPVMAQAVHIPALRTFFASPLYREMRESEKLLREFRFNVQLPAAEFTRDAERKAALADAKLLVQGVVDCCFLLPDGSLKLLDYKTDRLGKTPAEGGALLWERYADQLYYYKKALEQILHRPVRALSLYSFRHGCEFPLPEMLRERFGINN